MGPFVLGAPSDPAERGGLICKCVIPPFHLLTFIEFSLMLSSSSPSFSFGLLSPTFPHSSTLAAKELLIHMETTERPHSVVSAAAIATAVSLPPPPAELGGKNLIHCAMSKSRPTQLPAVGILLGFIAQLAIRSYLSPSGGLRSTKYYRSQPPKDIFTPCIPPSTACSLLVAPSILWNPIPLPS